LGYGGVAMIPRTHVTILDNAIRNRLVFYGQRLTFKIGAIVRN
jgi:hypothetical protein